MEIERDRHRDWLPQPEATVPGTDGLVQAAASHGVGLEDAGVEATHCAAFPLRNDMAPTPMAAKMMSVASSALPLLQEPPLGLQHDETFSSDGWQQVVVASLEEQPFSFVIRKLRHSFKCSHIDRFVFSDSLSRRAAGQQVRHCEYRFRVNPTQHVLAASFHADES